MGLTVKQQPAHAGRTADQMAELEHQDTGAMTVFQSNPLADTSGGDKRDFLPYARIAWPVEDLMMDDGAGGKTSATHRFVLCGGARVSLIPAGSVLTVLARRCGTKEKVKDEKTGKNRNVRSYNLSKNPEMQKFHAAQLVRFEEQERKAKEIRASGHKPPPPIVTKGDMWCVGVLMGETCAIAILDAFASQTEYWHQALVGALSSTKAPGTNAVKLLIDNHRENANEGESKFYVHRKFTQWQNVRLTPEQVQLVRAAATEHTEAINAWLSK